MDGLILVYFSDCPNAKRAREILERVGLPFRMVDQDTLSAGDPLLGFSSPSILANGRLIFGGKTQNLSRGCTTTPLNEAELVALLKNL